MTGSKRILPIVAAQLFLLIPGAVDAQVFTEFDTLRAVSMQTDKSSYELFEAVVVTVDVSNPSDRLQFFGSPVRAGDGFHFRVVDPRGESLRRLPFYELVVFDVQPDHVPYHPGQTKSGDILLNLFSNVWDTTGTYIFEAHALNFEQEPTWVTLATTTFEVTTPVGVDPWIVDTLRYAANGVFGMERGPSIEGAIDTVLSLSGLPSYLIEFVRYLDAALADIESTVYGAPADTAVAKYQAFENDFPGSPYKTATDRWLTGTAISESSSFDSWGNRGVPGLIHFRVFFEGAYNSSGDSMSTEIRSVRPVVQPFTGLVRTNPRKAIEPLNHAPFDVDWASVVLVDTTAHPDTLVSRSPGLVTSDGWGGSLVWDVPPGEYFLVVDHRNHLAIASDSTIDFTNRYAEHDFTTGHAYGVNPQAILETSPDTVYGMWTGDGAPNGIIHATDFNVWLTETKAVASGYITSDYNMDTQSTASDFNLWLVNTKKVVTAPGLVRQVLYGSLEHTPWTGESSGAAPKVEGAVSHRVRYRVTGNAQHEPLGFAWVPLEVRTNSASIDTLGNATFDVYFNKDQMYYNVPQQYQELLDAGYFLEIHEGENEHGPFVRVDIGTAQPDTTRYLLDSTWDKLLRIGFKEEDGTITDHGAAANRGTTHLGLLSNGTLTEPDSVAIHYEDVFQY